MAEKTPAKAYSVTEMMKVFQKDLGKEVAKMGGDYSQLDRVPSGLFPFDLASGGGFPRGRASIVYGPESSGKTNLALCAIAMHQLLWPDLICVFVAIEPFDGQWAKKIGVDTDKLVVVNPDYAEQVVDIVEGFLAAPDVGLVVLDSIAAMISTAESEKDASAGSYGGNSVVVGKLVRKSALVLRQQEKADNWPTLIYINQTRMKIGVMYGDNESLPGGNAPLFQAHLRVRTSGKNVIIPKVHKELPAFKETHFILKKHKVPITSMTGMYSMCVYPHSGLRIGDVDDFSEIKAHLNDFGKFEKSKKGWIILDNLYTTQDAFKHLLYNDRDFGADVRTAIIKRLMLDTDTLISGDGVDLVDD